MIKVTLELDYPNIETAVKNNLAFGSLIESEECISFSHMEELPGIYEFITKKNEKIEELYTNMGINPENVSAEMKKSIELIASEWMHENYYYHFSSKPNKT